MVAPEKLDKGKFPDSHWLDEDRVQVVKRGVKAKPASAAARAGGPQTVLPPVR